MGEKGRFTMTITLSATGPDGNAIFDTTHNDYSNADEADAHQAKVNKIVAAIAGAGVELGEEFIAQVTGKGKK